MGFLKIFTIVWILLAPISANASRLIGFSQLPTSEAALIVAAGLEDDLSHLETVVGQPALNKVKNALKRAGFEGKSGETKSLFVGDDAFGEIHVIGIGSASMRARDWEDFGGRAGKVAAKSKSDEVLIVTPQMATSYFQDIAFGASVGGFIFSKYKTEKKDAGGALNLLVSDATAAERAYSAERRHVAHGVMWARNLISTPANDLYPEEFVRRARKAFNGVSDVKIYELNVSQMQKLGMGAILGVGQGSIRPPRMLVIEYFGSASRTAPMVFAGKGITFDSGGISIKPNSGMWKMKYDMAGAAAVTGAVLGLAKSKTPVNVVAIAALAENMPSDRALRPGDVIEAMSGTTIEIMSTDAEGRLVLADAVWYAQEKYNPSLLVDVATLTGSAKRALGDEYGALFVRDDKIADRMREAGEISGEDVWQLPLHPNYKKQIKSVIADIKNSDTGAPGAGTGAQFIGSFVKEETPWVHLDIAGVGWRTEALPTTPKGAAGYGVRLLDRLARESVK